MKRVFWSFGFLSFGIVSNLALWPLPKIVDTPNSQDVLGNGRCSAMGKRYDKEFKIEAVGLASEPGNTQSAIERDLGLGQGVISRWKRELHKDGEQAFPGKGRLKPQDEQMRSLRREVERLRRERDILKKAVAIFSEDPNRYSGS
jgi:transposase